MTDRALFLAPTFRDGYDRLPERIAAEAAEAWSRLQRDPLSPGLNWERLFNLGDDARVDSIRVTRKYRLILATMEARFVLLWVDNHDEAYQWAERHRKQIESLVDRASEMRTAGIGVPRAIPRTSEQDPIPIESPDVLVEMAHQGFTQYFAALDEQQSPLVTLDTSGWGGLAFVKGGAGTGKSSIAIRRAIHVASMPGPARGRVLYLCYNRVLAEMVRHTIDSLVDAEVAGAIEVSTLHSWASTYAKGRGRRVSVDRYGQDLQAAVLLARVGLPKEHRDAIADLSDDDLVHEIRNVLRPNQFESSDAYQDLTRPRSQGLRPLQQSQRLAIWELDRRVHPDSGGPTQWDDLCEVARQLLAQDPNRPHYRAVILDEAQDCSPVMARLARAIAGESESMMMVFADAAQSIYAHGFSWAQRELNPPGSRVRILRQPYRSTRQIHELAASLYESDEEMRREIGEMGASRREGPIPRLALVPTAGGELEFISAAVRRDIDEGTPASQIAILTSIVRRARQAARYLESQGIETQHVSRSAPDGSSVSVLTVHSAKGLDFSSVYLLDFQPQGGATGSERAQLYVALTRSSHALTVVYRPRTRSALLAELDAERYEVVDTQLVPA